MADKKESNFLDDIFGDNDGPGLLPKAIKVKEDAADKLKRQECQAFGNYWDSTAKRCLSAPPKATGSPRPPQR